MPHSPTRTHPEKSTSRRLAALDADLRAAFFALSTVREVAELLDVPHATLMFYTYRGRTDQRYHRFQIPKRRGGVREISSPTLGLKLIQQKLNQVLLAVYETKPAVHGFARDKNIATNATTHRRRRYVLNADLANFFPSINFGRVRGMFMAKPYARNAAVATILAQICCFDDQLPQGAPVSPTVSNMICGKLDSDLRRLAQRVKATYTRYADDLTFSTNERSFPSPLATRDEARMATAGRELTRVIEANGFVLNPAKTRLLTRADRQEVTGLVVNQKVNIPREYIRRVRAMLHRLRVNGAPKEQRREVKGRIDFIGQIRGRGDQLYRKLLMQYAAVDPSCVLPVPPEPRLIASVDKNVWVVEWINDDECSQGTAFLVKGLGFVTCAHVLGPDAYAYRADTPNDHRAVRVIHADGDVDLALISIDGVPADELAGLALSDLWPDTLQRVYVAGFPDFAPGATLQVHPGYVAGIRTIDGVPILSLGASIFAGASGGPVLNEQWEVVGIAVRGADKVTRAHETNRYGAIPIKTLRAFVERARRATSTAQR
jgi:RNA-directed DNA polymerase